MNKKELQFIQTVWDHYENYGRRTLPWRKTKDPYKILVSEVMLQQTQVDRVKPKYSAFLGQFPTVFDLAAAPLKDVLIAWQGLGYNRRAKMLHACAQAVVQKYAGKFPQSKEALVELPGIGAYTAGAVMAFAFNKPVVLIETNVRSVYLHHFFSDASGVSDAELLPLIEKTLSKENARDWYAGLMDYGTYLKKQHGNPNTRSAHHAVQAAFKGSDRQIRGAIIKLLIHTERTRKMLLAELSAFEDVHVDAQLEKLKKEGMILFENKKYTLPK